ncbi:GNAT family N-acetyltransferase [Fulvivirga sp. M361]|uniref:GNAT family N-acetyltransferase n=1 Tax=Fulvivirga sp. M361 TaxID=2594266 RepID=UPI00117AE1DE|nr:GNAT family N-acetyltransferase [Fulvivirga sp. M361]TRX59451.1 GNAT family N-acetyltransferase [Fulvivirga sp. M361]
MAPKTILETERLSLREFEISDADFILKLVNTPDWLKFIGDKGVKSVDSAENYLKNGPIKSYKEHGYGLWLVQLKDPGTPIGMCGLVNRATLENIDIGFAMLPEYSGLGYGFEMANATLTYAKNSLGIHKVVAITDPNNIASIKLLNKIGLHFEKTLNLSENDSVLLFSPLSNTKDRKDIDKLTTVFLTFSLM